jgi:hypothetical protein
VKRWERQNSQIVPRRAQRKTAEGHGERPNIEGDNMGFFSQNKKEVDYKLITGNILSQKFGEMDETVLHSPVPFSLGHDIGGRADVYQFSHHLNGIVYITCDLWGSEQQESDAHNYELMIAHRKKSDWGPNLISLLAYYSLEASINSLETMDLPPDMRNGSSLVAILFHKYCEFKHNRKKLGVMLVMGISQNDLNFKKKNGGEKLLEKLIAEKKYPFTDA